MKQSIVGLKLLRHLAASGLKIFTVQQVKEATCELNLNPNYTTQALHHLVKEHWITRLKKGVYAFSGESGFGEPPHDFEIAMALVTPCAISHWMATFSGRASDLYSINLEISFATQILEENLAGHPALPYKIKKSLQRHVPWQVVL